MRVFLLSLVVIVAGCATSTETTDTQSTESASSSSTLAASDTGAETVKTKSQVVCTYEVPTGSHRSRRVCRTVAQQEANQKEARDRVRRDSYRSSGGAASN